ncbi:MAG: DUF5675 family protein [Acidobacteriota bacterium]
MTAQAPDQGQLSNVGVVITRVAHFPWATYGVLRVYGGRHDEVKLPNGRLWTLEPPSLGNEPFVSCIPEGVYQTEPFESEVHGTVISVIGVKGRIGILFHPLNYPHQTRGCVGVGVSLGAFGPGDDVPHLGQSRLAMASLIAVAGRRFTLQINSGRAPDVI